MVPFSWLGLWAHFCWHRVFATSCSASETVGIGDLGTIFLQTSMAFKEKPLSHGTPSKMPRQISDTSRWTPSSPTAIAGACGHNFNFSHPDPRDPSWSAEEFITAWEEVRSKLSVPFWMYDGMVGMTNFSAAQTALQHCIDDGSLSPIANSRHSGGEFMIYKQLQHHPWRVASSKDAKIIVVPIAMVMLETYLAKRSFCSELGCSLLCPGYDAVAMFNAIRQGLLFQQRSNDHLWVSLDDMTIGNNFAGREDFNPMKTLFAKQCTEGPWTSKIDMEWHFRGKWNDTCRYPNTLTAPMHAPETGTPENEARSIGLFFGGQTYGAWDRPGYDVREQLFKHYATMPARTLLITNDSPEGWSWPQCPDGHGPSLLVNRSRLACTGSYENSVLQHSQYAICARGDNPTSPRLYDAMNFGAIPIFLSDEAFLTSNPFQCLVPYPQVSLKIAEADCFEECGVALKNATAHFDAFTLHRTRKLIRHFRKDLLWRVEGSRVMENLLLTALQIRNPHGTNLAGAGCCGVECHPI